MRTTRNAPKVHKAPPQAACSTLPWPCQVRELRVSSRSPLGPAPGVVDELLQRAAARGLPAEAIAHVRPVNHSRCKEPAPLVV